MPRSKKNKLELTPGGNEHTSEDPSDKQLKSNKEKIPTTKPKTK